MGIKVVGGWHDSHSKIQRKTILIHPGRKRSAIVVQGSQIQLSVVQTIPIESIRYDLTLKIHHHRIPLISNRIAVDAQSIDAHHIALIFDCTRLE